MKKKITATALCATMAVSLLANGSFASAAEDQETVNITIYAINTETEDHAEVMEALNEYTKEKIGITADWQYLGGTFSDKVNSAITSGEEFDACFTSNWTNPFYNISVSKGAFMDISEMLPEVAPKLWETLPDYLWEGVTVDGGIYGIPNQQIVARQLGILVPQEFLDATDTDISELSNLTDVTDYAQKCYDQFGALVNGPGFTAAPEYCGYEFLIDYTAAGAIKMDDEKATVVDFYETEEWKSMLNELAALNEKGLLYDPLADAGTNMRLAKKLSAIFAGTYKPGGDQEESAVNGYPSVLGHVALDPYISTSNVVATMYGISATSKHPEETLKYFELVNTDPYVMNLLTYGIEGKHYEKVDDNTVKLAEDTGYYQASWALGNVFLTYALDGQPSGIWEDTKALNDSARKSPILGFSFDTEAVKNEIANMTTVIKEYEQLGNGQLSPDVNDEFVEKLKVAGVDTVIAEMQRQVDEFMASK